MGAVTFKRVSSAPYNETAAGRAVGQTRPATGEPVEIRVATPCPRCEHDTVETFPLVMYQALSAEATEQQTRAAQAALSQLGLAQRTGSREVLQRCECTSAHPRANGERGCGAFWSIVVTWDGPEVRFTAGATAPGWEEFDEADAERTLGHDELALTRKSAESWRIGLATLAGGFAIFAVIKGPATIAALQGTARVWLGTVALAGFALNVTAAITAMYAAYGFPHRRRPGATGAPLAHDLAGRATMLLRWTIGLTLASLALLVTGVAITWYAPAATGTEVRVVQTDGTVVCGTWQGSAPGAVVIDVPDARRSVAVALRSVAALSHVPSCS